MCPFKQQPRRTAKRYPLLNKIHRLFSSIKFKQPSKWQPVKSLKTRHLPTNIFFARLILLLNWQPSKRHQKGKLFKNSSKFFTIPPHLYKGIQSALHNRKSTQFTNYLRVTLYYICRLAMTSMRKKCRLSLFIKSYFYYQVTTRNEKKLLTIYAVLQSL